MIFKAPNLVRTFPELATFPEIQKKKKYSNCVKIYFPWFTKVCNIQNTQYSKIVLLYYRFFCTPQRGGSVFLSWHLPFFCLYKIIWKDFTKGSQSISAHMSMKIILVDPNLVRTFFGNIFLILITVHTLENNYFLVSTKLGYLQYQEDRH